MKRLLVVFVCAAIAGLCATPAPAQTQTGNINGTVRDPNGEALPGVTVTLSGASVMGTKTAVTGASGVFRFPALLPGADYVVEFSLDGFQGKRFENIVVQVGQTATLQVVLELAAVSGEITVTDQSPIVDVTSPTSSTNMSTDLLDNIPVVDHSWEDNVNQAAGVVDGSAGIEYAKMFSMRGGSVHANQSAFDGVANTDPTYNAMASGIVYESVEEVQVVNGAMPAELGNISGGFINVVTKSGGNQFRGDVGVYYKSEDLQSENVSSEQEAAGATSQKLTDYDDWSFNLGGPIVRDKLWFNVSYGTRNTSKTVPMYSGVDTVENEMYFGKLTWQPSVRHSVVGMYNFHKLGLPTLGAAPFVTPDTTYDAFLDYEIAKLKWTAILSDDVFLEVDWGRRTTEGPFGPRPDSGPQYYDLATQITSGGAAFYLDNKNGRDQAGAALSVFKDDWAGSHQFKFGLEYEDAFYDLYDYNNVSPVMQHNVVAGVVPLYVLMFNGTPGLLTQVEREAFNAYAQDTWSVSDRVTLSLGVRVNTWTGGWPHQSQPGFDYGPFVSFPAQEFEAQEVIDWTSWEPRLGVTVTLDDQGKSVLRAGVSRYHLGLLISHFILGNPNSRVFTVNPWLDLDGDLFADPDEVYPALASVGTPAGVDPNLEQPYTDEITLGFEKEIFRDFALTLNVTWRDEPVIVDDANVSVSEDSYLPTDIPDPGPDSIMGTGDDRTLTVFNQIADFDNLLQYTNPEVAKREYRGVELIATKRLSNNWQLLASLTWQEATGTLGNDTSVARGYSSTFNDANTLINADGVLSLDRTWQFKVVGTYLLPLGFSMSGNWQYQTGAPLYRIYDVILNQGSWGIIADPKGTHRYDDLSKLDLRAEKIFSFGARPVELGLILDVFNVFNENTPIVAQDSVGSYAIASSAFFPSPGGFGSPVTIQEPRTIRLGARLRF